ncbi:MAG: helix-turn-helix domain-containing protein [Thermoprotei archaeon]
MKVAFVLRPPKSWITELVEEGGVHIHVLDAKDGVVNRGVEDLVYITSQKGDPHAIVQRIRRQPDVVDADLVRLNEHQLMGSVRVKECPVCSLFAVADGFLIGADVLDKERMRWEVFVKDEDSLRLLSGELQRRGIEHQLVEKVHLKKTELTARQDQILRIALELGYFDFPKRIRLETLAQRLGVTAGTLSEVLRRGVKKALREYLSYKRSTSRTQR